MQGTEGCGRGGGLEIGSRGTGGSLILLAVQEYAADESTWRVCLIQYENDTLPPSASCEDEPPVGQLQGEGEGAEEARDRLGPRSTDC
jgi:hypothetical protein